ncbi:MAG: phosphatase PAP2 family protein [Pseudomonadota bacterium]
MNTQAIATLKLQIPAGKTHAFWLDEAKKVYDAKWHRDERLQEIYLQQSDILSFLGAAVPLSPASHPWTTELLSSVNEAIFSIEAPIKYHFSATRPNAMSRQINPVIQTPAHSSFPSGHATESFGLARVISHLYFGGDTLDLRHIARRIAENRTFAGVHFPVDNSAGAVLGDAVGAFFVSRLLGTPLPSASTFAVTENGDNELVYPALADIADETSTTSASTTSGDTTPASSGADAVIAFYMREVMTEITGRES